jgi:2-polyprenyl-6-methoxyphenol hydroxylase-like FAD-dependent oxidoreductase
MAGDTRWLHYGDWKTRFASGMTMLSQSRSLLEAKVRERVAALPGVRLEVGRSVVGLLGGRARAGGVRLAPDDETLVREDGSTASVKDEIAADLVVDASGRGSRTPQWLETLGIAPPAETEVRVDVGYASRLFVRPARPRGDWLGLMIYPTPPGTRLGVLFPVEDGRWLVTLVGWFGDHPGASDAGFLEFAKSLDAPDIHDAIREAEPASPVAIHKFPSNRRRHYERMEDLPEGLVVLGDAFCSFNPIYGQGMTTGALGARTLDECLRAAGAGARSAAGSGTASAAGDDPLRGLTRSFHRELARVIASPWLMTTTEDFRSRSAEGARPAWAPLLHWYTERVHKLTWSDPFVAARFLQVMHLTAGPSALFHPYVVWRALGLPAAQPSPPRSPATARGAA